MLLQGASATIENLTYAYDANGNRQGFTRTATQTLSPAMTGTNHDAANEMLAYNSKNLVYDANGNLLTKTDASGTTTYTWDTRNRLAGISGPSLTASFSYDAINRRIGKTINGTTTQFVYDGRDVTQEIKAGVKTNYIRTLNIDEPLSRISSATTRHYVADALGSTVALADDTGATKTTYVYDAFGNVTVTGEASDNPFQYTGRENDGTGLNYYRARYYSQEMQRFISEDPIRLNGGDINYFAYTRNNPLNHIDQLGLYYLDLNFSFGFVIPIVGIPIPVGVTGGVMFDKSGMYPYAGGGIMTPGIGVSLMWPKNDCDKPVPGWTVTGQGGYGLGGQRGYSFGKGGGSFTEWGISSPGAGVTGYYVFNPITLSR